MYIYIRKWIKKDVKINSVASIDPKLRNIKCTNGIIQVVDEVLNPLSECPRDVVIYKNDTIQVKSMGDSPDYAKLAENTISGLKDAKVLGSKKRKRSKSKCRGSDPDVIKKKTKIVEKKVVSRGFNNAFKEKGLEKMYGKHPSLKSHGDKSSVKALGKKKSSVKSLGVKSGGIHKKKSVKTQGKKKHVKSDGSKRKY